MRYSGLQGTNTFEAIATDQAGNQNQFNASIVITDVEIQGASSMAVHWDYVTVLVLVAAVFFST